MFWTAKLLHLTSARSNDQKTGMSDVDIASSLDPIADDTDPPNMDNVTDVEMIIIHWLQLWTQLILNKLCIQKTSWSAPLKVFPIERGGKYSSMIIYQTSRDFSSKKKLFKEIGRFISIN